MGEPEVAIRDAVRSAVRRLRGPRQRSRPIWSGVYPTFLEIETVRAAYETTAAVEAAEGLLREMQQDPLPREAETDHQVLALAVRFMNATEVAVIDHGGGVGQSYAALRRLIPAETRLRYCVIDLDPIVMRGREVWRGNSEIELTSRFDLGVRLPSIIFSKGFIQYLADWAEVLRAYFSAGPRFVLLEKLPIVSAPTYATLQLDVYGADLPYWMFNLSDIESIARAAGYRIALQRRLDRVYDQSDFSPELRMERATSLLLERA
jgi:putative methyltransferase (TIGR04325 family)